ncbi:hypothetical protein DOTSEDRAFT_37070 [Dothistroma septosporum NZE10]|uniref:Uncharacterized protein n=1 Tax=Dothistroma septosporum (strain NZE10 / CBS 128990) TaxID=675120 RepID=N1PGK8_DOTSN|nr:hypothetical protein DOTSEDRAFT_37070 [Dothistroma septosporum NZE10]
MLRSTIPSSSEVAVPQQLCTAFTAATRGDCAGTTRTKRIIVNLGATAITRIGIRCGRSDYKNAASRLMQITWMSGRTLMSFVTAPGQVICWAPGRKRLQGHRSDHFPLHPSDVTASDSSLPLSWTQSHDHSCDADADANAIRRRSFAAAPSPFKQTARLMILAAS